jgi:2-isopropylmalate synthase|tara:strand:+ start:273 stop:1889 length:1617 start_codon:yes stop_codon:yes gene_type:complete
MEVKVVNKEKLYIFDTTLRDGAQTHGVDFNVDEKKIIANKLDLLGVDYIEGGWPGANATDTAFFNEKLKFKNASFTAFGMTKKAGRSAENDPGLASLINTSATSICVVGKSWDFHVELALEIKLEENLENINQSIDFIVKNNKEALFDAEHFFDGFKANKEYALKCLQAALDAGARWIVLCDTNGGTLPHEVTEIIAEAIKVIPGEKLGIHAHNDTGNAVANSLAAIHAGVRQVQGTINGLGERCGNANLVTLIPTLLLKPYFKDNFELQISKDGLKLLTDLSRLQDEILNRASNKTAPYVGASAFAHKGGLHVSAVNKDPKTYEHIDPSIVGNQRQIVISEQSGKSNIIAKLKSAGIELNEDDQSIQKILDRVKEREFTGYTYDGADASFELLVKKVLGKFTEFFDTKSFKINIENSGSEGSTLSKAEVIFLIGRTEVSGSGEGNGPINALDNAIRNSFESSGYASYVKDLNLIDYKVRILNTGTDAVTRVSIESIDKNGKSWFTVGVSDNIIEASFKALIDSVEYKLMKDQAKPII